MKARVADADTSACGGDLRRGAWILEARARNPLGTLAPRCAVAHTSADEYSNTLWGHTFHMVGALLTLVVRIELHDRCSERFLFVFVQFQVNHQILEIVVVQPR